MFQTEVLEKLQTHILCSRTSLLLENLVVYELMRKIVTKVRLLTWRVRPTVCLSVCPCVTIKEVLIVLSRNMTLGCGLNFIDT
jgi:hypothetical protein